VTDESYISLSGHGVEDDMIPPIGCRIKSLSIGMMTRGGGGGGPVFGLAISLTGWPRAHTSLPPPKLGNSWLLL
jgi:hypothetical protein